MLTIFTLRRPKRIPHPPLNSPSPSLASPASTQPLPRYQNTFQRYNMRLRAAPHCSAKRGRRGRGTGSVYGRAKAGGLGSTSTLPIRQQSATLTLVVIVGITSLGELSHYHTSLRLYARSIPCWKRADVSHGRNESFTTRGCHLGCHRGGKHTPCLGPCAIPNFSKCQVDGFSER